MGPGVVKEGDMAEHKIRTVMRPDEEIVVDDAELLDLQRQGLVAKPENKREEKK